MNSTCQRQLGSHFAPDLGRRGHVIHRAAAPPKYRADVNQPRAIAAAAAAAMLMAGFYALLARHVGEQPVAAILIGALAGNAARWIGGGRSIFAGLCAAIGALISVLIAKALLGMPEGYGGFAQHATGYDLVFCYVLNPLAALFGAATHGARSLLLHRPGNT
jgi:hypothetical protein